MTRRVRLEWLLVSVLLLVLFSPNAFGELIFSQPKSVYNFGDEFNFTLNLVGEREVSDFLSVALVCGEEEREIYRAPLTLAKDEQRQIEVETRIDEFIVGQEGDCYLRASYDGQEANSQRFRITREVSVFLSLHGATFYPNDKMAVSGEAVKENGEKLDGFVEISIEGMGLNLTREVKDGEFNFSFTIPETAPPGKYVVRANAYEKNAEGKKVNSGSASAGFAVGKVVKRIDIAIHSLSVKPTQSLMFEALAYDQAGQSTREEASLKITDPEGNVVEKKAVLTGTPQEFKIGSNFTSGNWQISLSLGKDLEVKKSFFVEEYEKVEFELLNNTLVVRNVGNVPFTGPLEIRIGNFREVVNIDNLGVGKEIELLLAAPDGDYEVSVSDARRSEKLGTAFLTGKAVSVREKRDSSFGSWLVLFWSAVILVLGVVSIFFLGRVFKGKFVGRMPGLPFSRKRAKEPAQTKSSASEDIIREGKREECGLMVLRIKNENALKESATKEVVESALRRVKDEGAKLYKLGQHHVAVFAPSITRASDNSQTLARAASKLSELLKAHNKTHANKIDFGVGIELGELIVETKEQGKFKFISVDNTLAKLKRIAELSSGEVFLGERIYRRLAGKVKTEKTKHANIWKLAKPIGTEEHEDFIARFKQRQSEK
ncbi:hypothetical protein D6817_00730 [Candidatus Pacearchaeota archaeon]|nr:MAG: hypothetical protein D6817_00730 [Candidatus Pacearchaeota archaeon]